MSSKPVIFKYLDLGRISARGGVVRFFMLANGIPYEESLYKPSPDAWGMEKKRLIETGENPCGSLPVVYCEEGDSKNVHLSQHIAICRYLARIHQINNMDDAFKDYIQDLVADEYQGFRNTWAEISFGNKASKEEKEEYANKTLPEILSKFEALYQKYMTASPYLSTSPSGNPLWADSAMFSILYDHIQLGQLQEEKLKTSYPKLFALYNAYGSISAVNDWIDEKNALC